MDDAFRQRPWWPGLRPYMTKIAVAAEQAERSFPKQLANDLTVGAKKHTATDLIRRELTRAGLPLQPLNRQGEIPYLLVPDVAILRVKALDPRGRPKNYRTRTAVSYHEGRLLPDLPLVCRLDLSYRLDTITMSLVSLSLIEWRDGCVIAEYVFPWAGASARSLEALELELPESDISAKPEEVERRKRARPSQADEVA